jgi:hypothetical protein
MSKLYHFHSPPFLRALRDDEPLLARLLADGAPSQRISKPMNWRI